MSSPKSTVLLPFLILAFALSQGVALAQGPLVNGENHSGSISSAGQLHEWTFAASQNDAISISIGEVLVDEVDPGFNPWIRLRGPDGADLGSQQGALVAQINVSAPLTGTYTVVVASFTVPTATGNYLLTLAKIPGTFVVPEGDEGGPMTNGVNHPGVIHRGDLDQWSFTAALGDAISLSIGEVFVGEVDPGFNPWIRLRGPDGADLGSQQGALTAQINVSAPLTGTYTVVVASFTVPTATGNYLLTLAKIPGTFVVPEGDEGGPMTNGANHAGKIHRGDLDQWSFTAAQGDAISLSIGEVLVGEVDPGFNPWIRLRGPDGADLGSQQGGLVAQINVSAPLTGTYTAVVASFTVPTATGNYLLTLAKIPGTFVVPEGDEGGPMTNGVNHPGVIHRGDLDQWSFFAAQGATLSVSIGEVLVGEVDPGFNPWIRLRGPDGADLGSQQGALTAQINVTAPLTGTYTVVVASFTVASANGSYTLQVSGSGGGGGGSPTTVNDAYSTNFNTALVVAAPGVLANDNSNGGGAMTATLVTNVTSGTLSLNVNGGFTYTPGATFVGGTTFTYRSVNGAGAGNIGTVSLTVNAPAPPTTVADVFATPTDTPLTVSAPGVLANDNSNGGGALTATLVTGVSNGLLTLNGDGSVLYSPNPGFSGSDSFTYRAVNAGGPGTIATATISVGGAPSALPPTEFMVSSIVGNRVTLRWTAPVGGLPPTNYVLEGGVNPGQVLASISLGTTTPIHTFTAPTGAFYLRLHTIAGPSRSAASNEIRVFVNVPAPPSAPTNLLGLVNGSSLQLAWRNTFAGGAPGSVVLDVTGSIVASLPLGLTETFSFAGVPPGTYTFTVRAGNAAGTSTASNPVTLTFPGACSGAPLAPANFLAYKSGNSIFVVWSPAGSGPAPSGYVLSVTGAFVGSFSTSATTLSGTVGPGTYGLRVAATNACGSSAATAIQTVVIP